MEFIYEMLAKTVNVKFGNFNIPIPYVEVTAIVFLVFLLILSMAQFRRHWVDWSFKGALFGIFFGILLTITVESFLLTKGKTVVTELVGWKNAPKPITRVLDVGRGKLIQVLGSQDASASAEIGVPIGALQVFQSLKPDERKKIQTLICEPQKP